MSTMRAADVVIECGCATVGGVTFLWSEERRVMFAEKVTIGWEQGRSYVVRLAGGIVADSPDRRTAIAAAWDFV